MSIIDKLSKDSTNTVEHDKKEMWETLFLNEGDKSSLLSQLRKGAETVHEIKINDTEALYLRLLTNYEETIVKCFVSESLKYYKYKIDNEDLKADVMAIEEMKIKLMMASTKPNKPIGTSFLQYNADAQLTYKDLSSVTFYQLSELSKEYSAIQARFNPSLQLLPESELMEIVEMVKKSVVQPKDLNYNILLGILEIVIQQIQLEDKVFSAVQSTSQ